MQGLTQKVCMRAREISWAPYKKKCSRKNVFDLQRSILQRIKRDAANDIYGAYKL